MAAGSTGVSPARSPLRGGRAPLVSGQSGSGPIVNGVRRADRCPAQSLTRRLDVVPVPCIARSLDCIVGTSVDRAVRRRGAPLALFPGTRPAGLRVEIA